MFQTTNQIIIFYSFCNPQLHHLVTAVNKILMTPRKRTCFLVTSWLRVEPFLPDCISRHTLMDINFWLVVEPSHWKIWVCLLGWWHSQLNWKIKVMFQTTNQILFSGFCTSRKNQRWSACHVSFWMLLEKSPFHHWKILLQNANSSTIDVLIFWVTNNN